MMRGWTHICADSYKFVVALNRASFNLDCCIIYLDTFSVCVEFISALHGSKLSNTYKAVYVESIHTLVRCIILLS